jgi:hypothetical protein
MSPQSPLEILYPRFLHQRYPVFYLISLVSQRLAARLNEVTLPQHFFSSAISQCGVSDAELSGG